jgi:hypothetical protein
MWTWYGCLIFIPISLLLLNWALINSQFYRFLSLCSSKFSLFLSNWRLVILKNKGYPPKILFKKTGGLLNKEKFFLELQHFESSEWSCIEFCKWGAFWSPHLVLVCFSPVVYNSMFFVSYSVCFYFRFLPLHFSMFFPFYFVMLVVGSQYHAWAFPLLPNLWRKLNSVSRLVSTLTYPHCRELMTKLWSYMLLFLVPKQVRD